MSRHLVLALAPALALASSALAQPAPPPASRDAPRAEAMQARHDDMKRQRLEDLRTVLRLRPDQDAALAAFAAAHEAPRFTKDRQPAAPQTTPQRLESMERREDAMRERHQQRREALSRFYAALSPDQQKVFDALQRLQRGGHGGPGHRLGRGHGHGHKMMRHGSREPGRHDGPGA